MPQAADEDEEEEMVVEEPLELKAADADADAGADEGGEEQIIPGPTPTVEERTPPLTREEARAAEERMLPLLPQRSITS